MNTDQQENCARIFAILDPEGRGVISRDQVAQGFRLLNCNPTDDEINAVLDKYGNQGFTYEEFMSFIVNEMPLRSVEERKEDLRVAFTVFDRENSGWLEKETLFDILTKYGRMQMDEQDTRPWVELLDRRKDGKIRLAELEELFVSDEDVVTAIQNQKWELV